MPDHERPLPHELPGWLNERREVPHRLQPALDLIGGKVRTFEIIQAVATELRLRQDGIETSEEACNLLLDLVPRLALILDQGYGNFDVRSGQHARILVDDRSLEERLDCILYFGWGGYEWQRLKASGIDGAVRRLLVSKLADAVLDALNRWQVAGFFKHPING